MRNFERDADGLERSLEAVARRVRGHDRERRLTVAAVHREEQVGLLGLGGQTGRRPTALHVDHHERELEADREAERLRLQVEARAAGGGDPELAGERGADRNRGGRDLVLRLQRADAEVLVLRQLVEDVGRRGDRVGGVQDRQARLLGGGDEAVRHREVAGDVAVATRVELRGLDLVVLEELRGLAEVQPGLERGEVGVAHLRAGRELLLDPLERRVDRPGVHPRDQAEGEEVLRPLGVARLDPELLAGFEREARHRYLHDVVRGERPVVERVGVVADLGEVALVERVRVDEDGGARRQLGQVGLERRGVHGHEDVGGVARRDDVVVGDVHLEGRDTGDGARRRPDLRRVVRHGRQVVAEHRADVGEAVAGELHAVAGVAGEPDDDFFQAFGLERSGLGCRGHASLTSLCGLLWEMVVVSSVPRARAGPGMRAHRRARCHSKASNAPSAFRSAASIRRRSRARPTSSASTSTREPTPPGRW